MFRHLLCLYIALLLSLLLPGNPEASDGRFVVLLSDKMLLFSVPENLLHKIAEQVHTKPYPSAHSVCQWNDI